jgi:flavin reductase (DIM6/NTAB) family NADH-FMN oxidoreductase RutF
MVNRLCGADGYLPMPPHQTQSQGRLAPEKRKLGAMAWVYPTPIVLCGANVNGKPNYATLGDCGIIGIRPPLVYVALTATHHTANGIEQNQTFSVNFPNTRLMAVTDYCGMVSGRDVDKSSLFDNFYGETGTAPMIRECPVNLECRVEKTLHIHGRAIFIGQVVELYADPACVLQRGGRQALADMPILDPIIYALDNHYYRSGPAIGNAYSEGKGYR